jgi:hypothetical protein
MQGFKSENARLNSELARLNSELARLESEIASLKTETARLRASPEAAIPVVVGPSPVQQPNVVFQAGTLLAENAPAVKALGLEIKVAEVLLRRGGGWWEFGEFKARVVGKAPILVLVEFGFRGEVCGGFAAVPFENGGSHFIGDPIGTSFVFSLRPTAARYRLKDRDQALLLGSDVFAFGDGCIGVWGNGDMDWGENTYAVPSGWATAGRVKFRRFEVWRVGL